MTRASKSTGVVIWSYGAQWQHGSSPNPGYVVCYVRAHGGRAFRVSNTQFARFEKWKTNHPGVVNPVANYFLHVRRVT